jgi:hypothetical protein
MDHPPERAKPLGQRGGCRLQDQRRLDLVKSTVPHAQNFRETRPGIPHARVMKSLQLLCEKVKLRFN